MNGYRKTTGIAVFGHECVDYDDPQMCSRNGGWDNEEELTEESESSEYTYGEPSGVCLYIKNTKRVEKIEWPMFLTFYKMFPKMYWTVSKQCTLYRNYQFFSVWNVSQILGNEAIVRRAKIL